MKNLMAKLKLQGLAALLLKHGEKIALGTTGAIALILIVLSIMSFAGAYGRRPDELSTAAKDAKTKLTQNPFPVEQQRQFAFENYPQLAGRQIREELAVAPFEFKTLMSPKLYKPHEPISEPEYLAVLDLRAVSGKFLMAKAVAAPVSTVDVGMAPAEEMEPDEDDPENAVRRTGPGGRMSSSPPPSAGSPAPPGMRGPGMAGMAGMPGNSDMSGSPQSMAPPGRGVRYVSVRGVFPFRDEIERYRFALHLESQQAAEVLEFVDFKVQRQRAVAGKKPWSGEWHDIDIQVALELLAEAHDFDPDVVSADVTNPVFTMPLPERAQGRWTPETASHPLLQHALLTEEQQQQELDSMNTLLEVATEKGVAAPRTPSGGFLKTGLVRDLRGVQQQVRSGGYEQDLQDRLRSRPPSSSGGNYPSSGGSMPPRASGPGMSGSPSPLSSGSGMYSGSGMASGMSGSGMPGMSGGATSGTTGVIPKYLLFRYLDSAVEPGECYRYRVQLTVRNPNFEQKPELLKDPHIAEGEFRTTPWSEPSQPVAVERDVKTFLAHVARSAATQTTRAAADFAVWQWDPNLGTLIYETLPIRFGQYVGGEKRGYRLNILEPSYIQGDLRFKSTDILVDAETPPQITSAENPDLELPKDWKRQVEKGTLDEAVTVDQYGKLAMRDPISPAEEKRRAERILAEQRRPYDDIKDQEPGQTAGSGQLMVPGSGPDATNPRRGNSRSPSPLRARMSGSQGSQPPPPVSSGSPPPSSGGPAKKVRRPPPSS